MQANVQLWDMRQFDAKLQQGFCYRIERFGCKKTDNWQKTLNNPITLLFGRYTHVMPIDDDGFARHYFRFAAYNEVGQRADARDYALTGKHLIKLIINTYTVRISLTVVRVLLQIT